jgi:hypothetical protein
MPVGRETLGPALAASECLQLIEARVSSRRAREGSPHVIWDAWLEEALRPLNLKPRIRLLCPDERCGALVSKAFCYLNGVLLGSTERSKQPGGGVAITFRGSPNVRYADPGRPEWHNAYGAGVEPTARRTLKCPDCGKTATYSSIGILFVVLRAIADHKQAVHLGSG